MIAAVSRQRYLLETGLALGKAWEPKEARSDREDAMQIHGDTTLVEAARRIAPVIQEHNQEAERERRLSPPVLAALHEAGLLRMCTPRVSGRTGSRSTDPHLGDGGGHRARQRGRVDPRQPSGLGLSLRPPAG